MTPATNRPARPTAPVLHEGRLSCPRCESRLFVEGAELTCITCGYAYDPFAPIPIDVATRRRIGRVRHAAA